MTAPASFVLPMGALGLGVGSALSLALHHLPRDRPIAAAAPAWMPRWSIVVCGTGALFMAVSVRFGETLELPAYLYLVAVGVALALIDLDVRRLPDAVVLPSYVVSVLMLMPAGAARSDWGGAERAITGMLALLALFFALALAYPNGLGMGDVKLAGLLGMYLGWLSWNALFLTAIGSIFIAAVGGAFAIVTKHATRHLAVPIVPCLVAASLLALFLTAPISSWYGSLITV